MPGRPPRRNFSARIEGADATRSGIFGGPADSHRVLVPAITHYLIDNREVTPEAFAVEAEREAQVDYEWRNNVAVRRLHGETIGRDDRIGQMPAST